MKHIVWIGAVSRPLANRYYRPFFERLFVSWLASLVLVVCLTVPAMAADDAPVDVAMARMEAELALVDARRTEIEVLEAQVAGAEGISKNVLQLRLARA